MDGEDRGLSQIFHFLIGILVYTHIFVSYYDINIYTHTLANFYHMISRRVVIKRRACEAIALCSILTGCICDF
jgi:hypothetical protein